MRAALLILFLLATSHASAQKYMYVNTDNLIVRSGVRPDYDVLCVLHAPSQVEILPFEEGQAGSKAAGAKYAYIFAEYLGLGLYTSHRVNGFVEKKYLVSSLARVSVPGTDTTIEVAMTRTPLDRYKWHDCDASFHDLGREYSNAREYPAPVYKGGPPLPWPPKAKPRTYITGPRGGCYYFNDHHKKVYVDPDFCKGK